MKSELNDPLRSRPSSMNSDHSMNNNYDIQGSMENKPLKEGEAQDGDTIEIESGIALLLQLAHVIHRGPIWEEHSNMRFVF